MSNLGDTLEKHSLDNVGMDAAREPVPGLLLVFSVNAPRLYALPVGEKPILLGRGRVEGVSVDDGVMSRRHAEVSRRGGRWVIRDLGSRNGTAVDGDEVTSELVIDNARVLRVGDTLFRLCDDVRAFFGARVVEQDGVVIGPTLRHTWDEIEAAARSGETLHVTGETGSGKELAARHFHESASTGRGASGQFVAVNCATIPPQLAERLLFGAKKGAYSGADADSEGFLQEAHGGTLFLDEVAELELGVQAKLLRAIETREVTPLGSSRGRKVQLRLVSATHGGLREQVALGKFRQDLFFRIGLPQVLLPPLRDRPEDIPWLCARLCAERGLVPKASLIEAALVRRWPGNVRELVLEVREAVRKTIAEGATRVEARHLADTAGATLAPGAVAAPDPDTPRPPPTRAEIEEALERSAGNVARTARALGVHRTQLRRWLARWDIDPKRFLPPGQQPE